MGNTGNHLTGGEEHQPLNLEPLHGLDNEPLAHISGTGISDIKLCTIHVENDTWPKYHLAIDSTDLWRAATRDDFPFRLLQETGLVSRVSFKVHLLSPNRVITLELLTPDIIHLSCPCAREQVRQWLARSGLTQPHHN